ncbi:MAG: DUF2092 domain-containing protein [Methylococcus sp.]|nr:MAG: DUF2092 domain-containing protein [Methylococcus sp.]
MLGLAVLAVLPGCTTLRPAAPAPKAITVQSAAEPADAKGILSRMARLLAASPAYSVTIRDSYDVLQDDGQKIEFGDVRQVILRRPSELHIDVTESDGDRREIFYDGRAVTAFSPAQNVYAQSLKSGDIDAAIRHVQQKLQLRLPLAALLTTRFPEELAARTKSLDYVERTSVDGVAAHHLAGRSQEIDYQAWIAAGNQPLLLKLILTYRTAEGQPQFRAEFTDWNFSPETSAALFDFVPPKAAKRIEFLAELPAIGLPTTAATPSGETP